jgi:hypothetical protein
VPAARAGPLHKAGDLYRGDRGCGEETLMLVEIYALEADSRTLKRTIPVARCAARLEDMCRGGPDARPGLQPIIGSRRSSQTRPKEGREVTPASAAH